MAAPRPPAVLLNRGGGAAAARGAKLRGDVKAALAAAGIAAKPELLDGAAITRRARAAATRGDRLLIVGGGDGTIGAAAAALAGSKTSLGILPLGTLNHFARDLGIPLDLGEAAQAIVAGRPQKVDVAEVNGRIFVNNSAIGLYPLMVLDRDAQQDRLGRSKRLAMLVASARTLLRFKHHRLALSVNDQDEAAIDTPLLFVGNNDYSLSMPGAGTRACLDDGKLCVLVLRKTGRAGLIAATLRALAGRTRPDDMIRLDDVTRLRVASRRSQLSVAIDGETKHFKPPLEYRIRAGALPVIVPPAAKEG